MTLNNDINEILSQANVDISTLNNLMYEGEVTNLKSKALISIPGLVRYLSQLYDLEETDDFEKLIKDFAVDKRYYSKLCLKYKTPKECVQKAIRNGLLEDALEIFKNNNLPMDIELIIKTAAEFNQIHVIQFFSQQTPDLIDQINISILIGAAKGNQQNLFEDYLFILDELSDQEKYNTYLQTLEASITG